MRDIDLTVQAGEVVALLGANGSGKSTLVKAMVGLHPLSAGQISLFDEPLDSFGEWHRLGLRAAALDHRRRASRRP